MKLELPCGCKVDVERYVEESSFMFSRSIQTRAKMDKICQEHNGILIKEMIDKAKKECDDKMKYLLEKVYGK